METCKVPGCRSKNIDVNYKDNPVCEDHWDLHCNGKINLNELLKIKGDEY